jgi:hypothetical protein
MTVLFGNAKYSFQEELSSRPERTRISCYAALDMAACAPFRKEGRMKCINATKINRKSGDSGAEGSAVRPSGFPNSEVLTQGLKPHSFCALYGTTKVVP